MGQENTIIIAADAGIFIDSFQTISDAVGKCYGAEGLILTEDDVSPEFFNLRSGLAGELFQKLTNYQVKLALVLQNTTSYGERFSELAFEHRTHSVIRFFSSEAEAGAWLSA
jgi:hypothetical protein